MAGADMNGSHLEELVQREELIQEEEQEEEEAGKEALNKLDQPTKRFRTSDAGSSSPPSQPPPPGPATHIHRLPDDVLEAIFRLLSLQTIVKILSVCQRWQNLIEDRNLIKKLKFEEGTFVTEEAECLIRSAPGLKLLQLDVRSDARALLDAASDHCTNLRHLSVLSCYISGSAMTEALRKVFQANPRITDLRIKYVNIADRLQFCRELGAALPDLRKLEFGWGPYLELDTLIDGCSRNQMEEIKAWDCRFLDSHVEKLVRFWGRSLRGLKLDVSRLRDSSLARLAGCSELRMLKLVRSVVSGEGLLSLAGLSHLEELSVSHKTKVTPEMWCRFFSQSSSSRGLRKFCVEGMLGLDNSVFSALATFCPQLEELDAGCINATVSGFRELLRGCRKLHSLGMLQREDIADVILPELPRLAPQMRRICISSVDDVSDDTRRFVKGQMPHLRIVVHNLGSF